MRDLFHRVGATEVAVAKLEVASDDHTKELDDIKPRLRKVEYTIAKILGACIVGSALGNILLTKLTGCIGP